MHGKLVDVRLYFAFMTAVYMVFTASVFPFSPAQWAVVLASTGGTAVLMYNFKTLLLNTVYRKNADIISRACRWIGHKALYIYVFQLILMQLMISWAASS